MYHYNGAHWYKKFLQVGRLDLDLILFGLAVRLPRACVFLVFLVLYFYLIFLIIFSTLPFTELSLVRLALDLVE